MTLTVTVQLPLAGMLRPAGKVTLLAPAVAIGAPTPPQLLSPMSGPGADFYRWLVNAGFDYPRERWEWRACVERLSRRLDASDDTVVIVDLGSGDGGFMRLASRLQRVKVLGLDHNPDVVARCSAEGLDVIEGGLDDLSRRWPEGVDVVTFWHVIEHVEDPVGLLEASRRRLRAGGELCFSVPLTPMSYEHSWPDPFYEPPHHLTRWNLAALEALASRLGMRMELDRPKQSAPLLRPRSMVGPRPRLSLGTGVAGTAGRVRSVMIAGGSSIVNSAGIGLGTAVQSVGSGITAGANTVGQWIAGLFRQIAPRGAAEFFADR